MSSVGRNRLAGQVPDDGWPEPDSFRGVCAT